MALGSYIGNVPEKIKGWKKHKRMTMNLKVIQLKLSLYLAKMYQKNIKKCYYFIKILKLITALERIFAFQGLNMEIYLKIFKYSQMKQMNV